MGALTPPSNGFTTTAARVQDTVAAVSTVAVQAMLRTAEEKAAAAEARAVAAEAQAAAVEAQATAAGARATHIIRELSRGRSLRNAERLSAERALAKERAETERQQDQDTLLLREAIRCAEVAAQQALAAVAQWQSDTAQWQSDQAYYTAVIAAEKAATQQWKEIATALATAQGKQATTGDD